MREFLITTLFFFASLFILLAAIGLQRFPDVYCRLHATCKASTVAKIFSFFAALLFFWDSPGGIIKIGMTGFFFFVSFPVGVHLLARAAYRAGPALTALTWHDDYKASPPPKN